VPRVLVTGAAGFIGYHLCERLLEQGQDVCGLDNMNAYYDVTLKEARLARLRHYPDFRFERVELSDLAGMEAFFARCEPEVVVNLAAQAGVRYSLENPHVYVNSNVVGFVNLLECCRNHAVQHLVFASSSSVYGANTHMPFSVQDRVDHPVSLYAATKKSNELMAHTYSHLFRLPVTGLRFFTVYGPWGRPDMAPFLFTKAILEERPIEVFNEGRMKRDFTYVDDIVEGVVRVMIRPPAPDPCWNSDAPEANTSSAPYRLYNIGNHQPVELMRFIRVIEECTGRKAKMNLRPAQPGDVLTTYADIADLTRDTGFQPSTTIEQGLRQFVSWYRDYYSV
jgi:UDP-glucuronate 4-epimerase